MQVREREKRNLSFLGFEFGHDWRETGGVDLYCYFFGPPIQAFSFAYKEKKRKENIQVRIYLIGSIIQAWFSRSHILVK